MEQTLNSHSAGGATEFSATTILRVTWMRASMRLMYSNRDC